MKVLSLFAGIGGFDLGLERAGMEVVAQCEIDDFCRQVLNKHWPDVPCYRDVKELTTEVLERDGITAELIAGGYPCQPFSHAGKREGAGDDRHLWPEMFRLIETIRPRWVLAENVAGHISMGLDDVLSDLENAGYTCWVFVIPACAVDAKHRRDRVWIVGMLRGQAGSVREDVAHASKPGLEGNEPFKRMDRTKGRLQAGANMQSGSLHRIKGYRTWSTEPDVGRVAHGIPRRVDRLKSLGNAVVPQVAEVLGRAILKADRAST